MAGFVWKRVACPICEQPAGAKCRTLSGTNRVTDTHSLRFDAYYKRDRTQEES